MNPAKTLYSLFLTIFCLITFSLQAQTPDRCATEARMQAMYDRFGPMEKLPVNPVHKSAAVVVIPVHVIIVHPPGQAVGTGSNLSLPHIESQITVLTDDFRRMNSDAGNTPPQFPTADTEIEFCLATKDPNGNPTDGVTRYGTNQNLNNNEWSIKSATGWPRSDYLNIWVGPNLGGVLGWAYVPSPGSLPNSTLDGVVVGTPYFGGPGYATGAPYNLGRTATHEVGHYLGLGHIWGGGCGNDDGHNDTPNQQGPNWGCPNHPSTSCGNSGDMFMNYMDYVNDNCMNAFTPDQGNYMQLILNTSRSSILNSANTNCNLTVPLVAGVQSQTDATCFGSMDGTITVFASGGDGNYLYSIDGGPPQTSPTFTGLFAGPHLIFVQDGAGQNISFNVTIGQPTPVVPAIQNIGNANCFERNDGFVTVTASGGTPGSPAYEFSLDGGPFVNSGTFTGLSPGIHTVEVRDGNGCTQLQPFTITAPPPLGLTLDEIIPADCFGDGDAALTLDAAGGTPGYSYSLDQNNYQPDPTFSDLAPGDYLFSVLDDHNCYAEVEVEVVEPDSLLLDLLAQNDVSCSGEADGSVEVGASGGNPAYTYFLSGNPVGQNNGLFTDLAAGDYTIEVVDSNDCTQSLDVEIVESDPILAEVSAQSDVSCNGADDGSIDLAAEGGAGGYLYSLEGSPFGPDSSFDSLAGGSYTALIQDADGCTTSIDIFLEEPEPLDLSLDNANAPDCFEGENGSLQVTATGGNGNFTYTLDDNSNADGLFTQLPAGDYLVSVSDQNGCTNQLTATVEETPAINLNLDNSTPTTCYGDSDGSLSFSGTGGTGILTYTLNDEENTDGQFSGLMAGTYDLLVTDELGCTTETEAEVNQPEPLELILEFIVDVNCNGGNTGEIQVAGNGGNGGYNYTLNDETNTDGHFTDLEAGNYLVELIDQHGCATEETVIVNSGSDISVVIDNIESVLCHGDSSGMVDLSASGGGGDFIYGLNGQTNDDGIFIDLPAGDYIATIMDANDCTATFSFLIEEPTQLQAQVDEIVPVNCFGEKTGSLLVSANGGTPGYTFILGASENTTGLFEGLEAGPYTITVVDANGCETEISESIPQPDELFVTVDGIGNYDCTSGSPGSVELFAIGGTPGFIFTLGEESNDTGSFNGLTPGEYSATIEDANGCVADVNVTIEQQGGLEAEVMGIMNVDCPGAETGSLQVAATGGTGNFTYTLDGTSNDTGEFTELPAGIYTIEISDGSECSATIEQEINEPDPLTITDNGSMSVSCNGLADGSISLSTEGGTPGYQYTLGDSTNTDGFFSGLPAGMYSIEVMDDNQCTSSIAVAVNEPEALEITENSTTPASCFGFEDGSISVSGIGGTPDYTYTLDGESNMNGEFMDLSAGTYTIEVEDANGCVNTSSDFEISEPPLLELNNISVQDDLGNGDGIIVVEGIGGTAPYLYSLNNQDFQTEGTFSDLVTGDYMVYVLDDNDCLTSITVTVGMTIGLHDPVAAAWDVTLFPNPFQQGISIQLVLSENEAMFLEIFDIQGRKLWGQQKDLAAGEQRIYLEASENWPAGTYLLRVRTKAATGTYKLVKH